jgi:hypothetical protein
MLKPHLQPCTGSTLSFFTGSQSQGTKRQQRGPAGSLQQGPEELQLPTNQHQNRGPPNTEDGRSKPCHLTWVAAGGAQGAHPRPGCLCCCCSQACCCLWSPGCWRCCLHRCWCSPQPSKRAATFCSGRPWRGESLAAAAAARSQGAAHGPLHAAELPRSAPRPGAGRKPGSIYRPPRSACRWLSTAARAGGVVARTL